MEKEFIRDLAKHIEDIGTLDSEAIAKSIYETRIKPLSDALTHYNSIDQIYEENWSPIKRVARAVLLRLRLL